MASGNLIFGIQSSPESRQGWAKRFSLSCQDLSKDAKPARETTPETEDQCWVQWGFSPQPLFLELVASGNLIFGIQSSPESRQGWAKRFSLSCQDLSKDAKPARETTPETEDQCWVQWGFSPQPLFLELVASGNLIFGLQSSPESRQGWAKRFSLSSQDLSKDAKPARETTPAPETEDQCWVQWGFSPQPLFLELVASGNLIFGIQSPTRLGQALQPVLSGPFKGCKACSRNHAGDRGPLCWVSSMGLLTTAAFFEVGGVYKLGLQWFSLVLRAPRTFN